MMDKISVKDRVNRQMESFTDWLNEEYPGYDCSVDEDEFGNDYFTDTQVSMMFSCYIAAYRHSRIDAVHGFNLLRPESQAKEE